MTITTPLVCVRCGNPRPEGRSRYCSDRCKRAAMNARRRERDERGLPAPPDPRRTRRAPAFTAYQKFEAATIPAKRVPVPETPDAQRKAELLIERGCCAYRNRRGFIRDIGVPKKPEHRGKVWAVEAKR